MYTYMYMYYNPQVKSISNIFLSFLTVTSLAIWTTYNPEELVLNMSLMTCVKIQSATNILCNNYHRNVRRSYFV